MVLRGFIIVGTCVLLLAPFADAQVPGSSEPGRIEQRFQPPPVSKAVPEIAVPGPEAPLPPEQADSIRFQLSKVTIEGSTVYKDADLAALYQPLVGKEITLTQIYELRDAITAKYRAAGYLLSQAIVPPQKISGGLVRIQIVEGYVDKVSFEGDANDKQGLIAEMANKITRPARSPSM